MYDEFASFLATKLRERKETTRHLAEVTGIPEHTLQDFVSGNTVNLPAAPYIHGYVVKLGTALDFDGEAWWQQLKRAAPAHSSGTSDQLPRNRYSRNRVPGWALWGVPLALAVITFLGFRLADIIGLPNVAITTPDRDGAVFTESPTTLAGTATPGARVTINGETVPLTSAGTWEKKVTLQPGTPNDFTVEATKFLGRSRTTSRRIFFEPPLTSPTSTTSIIPSFTTSTTPTSTVIPATSTTPSSTIIVF